MSDELVRQARQDYGDLIEHIALWPPGLGIDAHLIGGEVVQYHPGGQRYVVDQPSSWTKTLRWAALIRGETHRLIRKS